MSLVVENLSKTFNEQNILNNFNFTMEPSEIVALVGESGTGKTTFIRILNELETADSGMVSISGDKLFDTASDGKVTYTKGEEKNRYRNNIGMVFQEYELFPNMSAVQNLIEAPLAQGVSKKDAEAKAMSLLDQMGLADKAKAMPSTLSGGQKQRVAIARSMMLEPDFLCFDEPTSALDRISAETIGEMIQNIATVNHTGMLIVTHDVAFANDFSDRLLRSEEFRA